MFCSKCGRQVEDTAAFCPSCGQTTGSAPAAPRGIPLAPGGGFVPPSPEAISPMPIATSVTAPPYPAYNVAAPARAIAYAGFWLRFVAWIIDTIVLQIAFTFIMFPFMAASGLRGALMNRPPQTPEEFLVFFNMFSKIILISVIVSWLYFALMESSPWQATLGKKALGLEVTDLDGRRISFPRATGRYFGKIVSSFILMIGYIMAGFTERKQALHDMMAGCLVIRKI
ncbi:MAG TPA: RDD family protein [Candidatus Dormibacteraeota bacterium]|nr:RDD family protein [Candidatus Dormibacteraeota bacterium]